MRYFVLCVSLESGIDPYIVAEVVRASDEERALSLAATLAGARSPVLTRDELGETSEGRRALEHWDADDDDSFDAETSLLEQISRRPGPTRLHAAN